MARNRPLHPRIVERITPIINQADPMGLLRIGAPQDEYSEEILAIAASRYRMRDAATAAIVIVEVFAHGFGKTWRPLPPWQQMHLGESVWTAVQECSAELYQELGLPSEPQ